MNDDDFCCICLECMSKTTQTEVKCCGKQIHTNCLQEVMLKSHDKCPYCRGQMGVWENKSSLDEQYSRIRLDVFGFDGVDYYGEADFDERPVYHIDFNSIFQARTQYVLDTFHTAGPVRRISPSTDLRPIQVPPIVAAYNALYELD
jgi:hypothetical protein